jgi:hypothetical protein
VTAARPGFPRQTHRRPSGPAPPGRRWRTHIWIYLPNFEEDTVEDRRQALFHEYSHTVQDWLAELRFQSVDEREQSFGLAPGAYYDDFEAYRLTL